MSDDRKMLAIALLIREGVILILKALEDFCEIKPERRLTKKHKRLN